MVKGSENSNSGKKRMHVKRRNLVQLGLILFIIVLVNIISSKLYDRFDLTTEKRYTLSDKTIELLDSLNTIVKVDIYLEGKDMPFGYQRLRTAVNEMLDEFRIYAGERIEVEAINPFATENEKELNAYLSNLVNKGVTPQQIMETDSESKSMRYIFPALIMTTMDNEVVVNLYKKAPEARVGDLSNSIEKSIQELEYEISNGIRKLTNNVRHRVAFLEGHGELDENQVADIAASLAEFYTLERVELTGRLDDFYKLRDFKCVVVAKPDSAFSEQDKFILDQYVMNGGRILWMLDFVKADIKDLQSENSMLCTYNTLNLEDLLFRFGARINPNLVQDLQSAATPVPGVLVGAQEPYVPAPWYYYPIIIPQGFHDITRNLDVIKLEFPSCIDTVGKDPNIQKTFLLNTSKYTKVVNTPARVSLDILMEEPDVRQYNKPFQPVAVLLEGTFESGFKGRSQQLLKQIESIEKLTFREVSKQTKMIVVADGDIAKNHVKFIGGTQRALKTGQEWWDTRIIYEGNKKFILNAVNYLCEDSGLMSLRSRNVQLRLLDINKIKQDRLFWTLFNIIMPLLLVALFGAIFMVVRNRRFKK